MTIEDRVARLEARVDNLDRIETRLQRIEEQLVGFRADNARVLERILATLQDLQRRPIVFRYPWEPFR